MTKVKVRKTKAKKLNPKRIKIPLSTKKLVRRTLELRKLLPRSKQFGLDISKADKLAIRSGIKQGIKLIRKTYLTKAEAIPYVRFYNRFRNCKTFKCKGALNLWGGQIFLRRLKSFVMRA